MTIRLWSAIIVVAPLAIALSCREDRATTPLNASVASQPLAATQASSTASLFRYPSARTGRSSEEIAAENRGCVACHLTDAADMHAVARNISCVDCHGGNPGADGRDAQAVASLAPQDLRFLKVKDAYHVHPSPRTAALWDRGARRSSANPEVPYAATLQEDIDFIRFVNPGDLRAAQAACGGCHNTVEDGFLVDRVRRSMMNHGAMLWEAALYNNGDVNRKDALFAEAYTLARIDGHVRQVPAEIVASPRPSTTQRAAFGWLPALFPIPRWEVSQPGNILRVFENGGKRRPVVGVPDVDEDPGRPDVKLSVRGLGTDVRTDPVFIGLQKTRLFDPTLNLFGTNDHAGDYRASGCSACHVVYANDRSSVHSARWAKFGNRGESFSTDVRVNPTPGTDPTTRPATEPGHPIAHAFEKNMPTSTCIVCHVHPGTNVLNAYLGFTWWDNETDGEFMYPRRQMHPSSDDERRTYAHNPEGASVRGLWSNLYPGEMSHAGKRAPADFLGEVTSLNPELKHVQFADFHGHGWVFRAVFKQDRHGNALDSRGAVVEKPDAAAMAAGVVAVAEAIPPPRLDKGKIDDLDALKKLVDQKQSKSPPPQTPVHLKDVHLEKGMQCADCHFEQDEHGDGHLYGETRNAVAIDCIDCHGTATEQPRILTALAAIKKADAKRGEDETLNRAADDAVRRAFSGAAGAERTTGQIGSFKRTLKNHFDRFESDEEGQPAVLYQRSALEPKKGWVIRTVADTVAAKPPPLLETEDKDQQKRQKLARYAHSVRKRSDSAPADAKIEYGVKKDELKQISSGKMSEGDILAHANANVACYACHSSWNTSCFGCHLAMRANQARPMLHNEGQVTRNYTNYNYQTLRDDVYMLGVDSTVKGHKVVPIRSACAVMVSSQDANRQWIYAQQQTVSAEGFAGTAFSPYFPHTVRSRETKTCNDCHLSKDNDNNAILAQLMLQGTNSVNFIGRFAWVAEGDGGLEAVAVTERDEPQAVIGSKLHRLAYPDDYAAHRARGGKLAEAHDHEGTVYDLQLRGEYLYAACGEEGFIAYDVANIDNKGFSERIVTAPVSPLGQRLYVRTPDARAIASPSTLALDPTRQHLPENQEGDVHLLYAFLYVADMQEGLVIIGNRPGTDAARKWKPGVATLLDGDPENNFLTKALSYNPSHLLDGARHIALYGHYAYICCRRGIVVVNLDNPLAPRVESTIANGDGLAGPRKIAFQFRYAFVVDGQGIKVLDVTNPASPHLVKDAVLPIADARDIYVCRTFGYVAAGRDGLIIVDLENPEALRPEPISEAPFDAAKFRKKPTDRVRRALRFTAGGKLGDSNAVRVGMTNNSLYAYIADGRNGLRVLQLTSDETPGFNGFSPIPVPTLIAEHRTRGPALSLSKGLDRDRAVDESGHQLSVFGRRGARPLSLLEQRRMYLLNPADAASPVWRASEDPADAADIGR
jgi:hypothetical protein